MTRKFYSLTCKLDSLKRKLDLLKRKLDALKSKLDSLQRKFLSCVSLSELTNMTELVEGFKTFIAIHLPILSLF